MVRIIYMNFDTIEELINTKVLHDGKSIKECKKINIIDKNNEKISKWYPFYVIIIDR